MKKENSTLLKKLQQYSALAAPMLATAGLANAQVVYTDVNPDVTLSSPGDSLLIDLNNDGVFDYVYRTVAYGTSGNWYRAALGVAAGSSGYSQGNQDAIIGYHNPGAGATIFPYVSALSFGHPIDDNQPMFVMADILFTSMSYNFFVFPAMNSVFGTHHYGQWQDEADHYAGLKFTTDGGSTFHFGWARAVVSADAHTITIKDYAYETTEGTPLNAGDGLGAAVHTPGIDDGVKIFSYNHQLNVNFETLDLSDASIRLFNILGEEIINQKVTSAQNSIGLKNIPAGTYMVQVNYQDKEVSKKIVIN